MRRLLAPMAALALFAVGQAQAADPVTINFWHYQTSNREDLTRTIDDFMAKNPDIKVREQFKDNNNLATEVQAAALAGRAPDVAQLLSRLTIGLVMNTKPVALDSGPDKGAFLKNVAPNFLTIGTYQGHPYAVPHSFGTPIVYYNKDLFRAAGLDPQKPPRTWQEMRELARQIKTNTGKHGLFVSTGGRDVGPQQMIVNTGADMLSADFSRATFATPDAIASMQLWQDMAVTDKSLAVFTERENTSLFMAGQIGMMVTSVASFQGAKRSTEGVFELGIGHYPTWNDKPRRVPNSGAALMVFSQDEKRREATFRFLAYLMQPEVSNRWAVESGYLPIAPGAQQAEVIKQAVAKEPRWGVAVAQMDDLVATARWPGSRVVEIQIVLENMVQALWQGKAPASELVPAAEAEISRLIAQGS
ncbi:MAG: ABC transporter substrate-binding protein [Chelatococcus sp.]|uniref:ABC transporter substrate-binding protein n=1 Tax=Chelatococcus sp. TaxID=1953771 RepID=UPI0025B90BB6|nr:ABC transporter substrate-binding protein [Chelatococcus sp.]MBX3539124.1 ABC transporter substrate-binding protein [Chelatococcus sp.]